MLPFLGRKTLTAIPFVVVLAGCGSSGDKKADLDTPDGGGGPDATTPDNGDAGVLPKIGDVLEGEHAGDQFGGSAIALSANGSRIVIGGHLNDDSAPAAGHARVFERTGNTWTQLGPDFDGEAEDDRFGGAVAISDDGTRIAIGSYMNDGGGNASGQVRVFDYDNGAWTQVGADIDGPQGRGAGWAIAMSASGHRVVVGGPGVGSVNGVVIVHEEQNGTWSPVGDPITGRDELGHAVTISDDGNRIALSLPAASGAQKPGTTRAYDWNGTAWTQIGADITGEGGGDYSGGSLSISGDGDILAVGSEGNLGLGAAGGGNKGGSARVFQLVSDAWTQLGTDLDGEPGSDFGHAVALSTDGTRLVVGAPSGSTAGYYTFSNDAWNEVEALYVGRRTGSAVAISADGTVGAMGAEYYDGTEGNASGGVQVYSLP